MGSQCLWPAGLYERCKLALEHKMLKTHDLHPPLNYINNTSQLHLYTVLMHYKISTEWAGLHKATLRCLYNASINYHNLYIYIYIKESRVSYTIYNSRTAEPIWLKIRGEVA